MATPSRSQTYNYEDEDSSAAFASVDSESEDSSGDTDTSGTGEIIRTDKAKRAARKARRKNRSAARKSATQTRLFTSQKQRTTLAQDPVHDDDSQESYVDTPCRSKKRKRQSSQSQSTAMATPQQIQTPVQSQSLPAHRTVWSIDDASRLNLDLHAPPAHCQWIKTHTKDWNFSFDERRLWRYAKYYNGEISNDKAEPRTPYPARVVRAPPGLSPSMTAWYKVNENTEQHTKYNGEQYNWQVIRKETAEAIERLWEILPEELSDIVICVARRHAPKELFEAVTKVMTADRA